MIIMELIFIIGGWRLGAVVVTVLDNLHFNTFTALLT